MTSNCPGWAIELLGDKIDLDDLRESFGAPFDPWLEDYQECETVKTVLRCSSWSTFTEAADVVRDARRVIERLSGELLLIHADAKPVNLGGVMRFDAAGKRENILFAATGSVTVTLGRVRGRAKLTTRAGQPPSGSALQKWFREAEADDVRAELFSHLSRADNWYDLYKCAELGRRLAGDTNKLKAVLGPDWSDWHRAWQTANAHRHAPDPIKYPLPNSAPGFDEARDIILKAIPRVL